MRKIPELLAPAGSADALYAAVKGGADAVYFGGRFANARNSAANFSDDEISCAVKFLRDNNKRAYITLNILHTDRELTNGKNNPEQPSALLKFAEHCYISGADAFIIQDIGLARIVKKYFPDIKIHASTQAAGHNLYSAQKFSEAGFSRMVAARELDSKNLKYLTANSSLEIEIFIHGALCSSYSGRCFMSFAIGNTRSANKGMCAQPCRMKYNGGYILSLKDLCLAGHIKDIIEISPACLKIEGRMKPPEYVYNVCKIYRRCLDENRNAEKREIDFLAEIFSRQGFTDGYFTGKSGSDMYGVRTEENKAASKNFRNIKISFPPDAMRSPPPPLRGVLPGISEPVQPEKSKNIKINPKLCLIFDSAAQFWQTAEYIGTDEILKRIYKIFLPLSPTENFKISKKLADITGVRLPYVIFDSERERITDALKNSGVNSVLIDNIGHIDFAPCEYFTLFGNFGLNITNSYALAEYRNMGFEAVTLSPELNSAQIRDINKTINCGITAYGKTHVMISENCLLKNCGAHKKNMKADGNFCEFKNDFYLTDKTGAGFLIRGEFGHRNIIYNSVPVYLADKKDLYKNSGLFFISLNFTDENPEQIRKIISDYAYNNDNVKPPEKFTRGLNK